jgi:hypothetical protein
VFLLIEILGNTQLFAGKGFGSAAFSPPRSSSNKSCLRPFPNQVSLKLCKRAKDGEQGFGQRNLGILSLSKAILYFLTRYAINDTICKL